MGRHILTDSKEAFSALTDAEMILFIDEACPWCHWFGRRAVRWNKKVVLAPLGGKTARGVLDCSLTTQKSTVVLYSVANKKCYIEADAIAQLLIESGFRKMGRLVQTLQPLSNWVYRIVAHCRPTRKNACPLPPADVRFLP